jgi:hypothetical protein
MRFLLLGSLLLITACGSQEPETPNTQKTIEAPKAPVKTTTSDTGHGHDHGEQHTISMSLSLAGVTLDITAQGTLQPNSEYHLEMALIEGAPGATGRVWIGEASGVGSMKTKADGHGDHYHGHAIVPKEINEKTALWIEVQSVTGDREIGRIALQ